MSEKMELILLNPEENGFLQHIDWNKEDIQKRVLEITDGYTNVVYTDDTMKQAKEDRADLNRLRKAIDDRRKMVKKKCMEPYEKFEKEVKEVLALIDEPVTMIDRQVKVYEAQKKAEKKLELINFFEENATEIANIFSFEDAFEEQYLNAGYTLKKAKESILRKVEEVKRDLKTIEETCEEKYKVNVLDVYTRTFNISKALGEQARLKELERKMEEEKKRKEEAEAAKQAEEARREEERQVAIAKAETEYVIETAENVIKTPENVPFHKESVEKKDEELDVPSAVDTTVMDPFVPQEDTKKYKASFTVVGTKAQISALKQYMISNNIEFGKVDR